jgi:NAD(P)H-dependent glutamate synthase small subunit
VGKPTGFIEYDRKHPPKRPVSERIKDYRSVEGLMPLEDLIHQASRCMDCGIPFCHSYGCPLGNLVPEWNDMVYHGRWREALDLLHSTSNFPEFTGRICPALCEAACTLNLDGVPVSNRHIELQIVERGWAEGWITPRPAAERTGFKVAVIGSGPSGLAAAQEAARAGHDVTVFEKDDRVGGVLRYGIPDYKLEKWVIDRRMEQLKAEGVRFETRVQVGEDLSAGYLLRHFDAVLVAAGSRVPRDLPLPGRELKGIHFALDFLAQQNKRNAGDPIPEESAIHAGGKNVVVVGGGDTGADCVGTSRRQGAASITQIEILPQPPEKPDPTNPWPEYPRIFRTLTAHEEGCERLWSVGTLEFVGDGEGNVKTLKCAKVENFKPIPGTEFDLKAELVLLAMGFLHVEYGKFLKEMGVAVDGRGNLLVDANFMTSAPGIFAAGDCMKGQSLVVHALNIGRQAGRAVDAYLRASLRKAV